MLPCRLARRHRYPHEGWAAGAWDCDLVMVAVAVAEVAGDVEVAASGEASKAMVAALLTGGFHGDWVAAVGGAVWVMRGLETSWAVIGVVWVVGVVGEEVV